MAASRNWVCIRLATYEDASEGELLETIFAGRGTLENTTTVLLAPDGKRRLSASGRGPAWLLPGEARGVDAVPSEDGPEKLADLLEELAHPYRGRPLPGSLPLGHDVRRWLNVASCDGQPLVILHGRTKSATAALEVQLAELAWSDEFSGRFQYVVSTDRDELALLDGVPQRAGVLVVQPGVFGLEGIVVASAGTEASSAALARTLHLGLERADLPEKELRAHMAQGRRAHILWESELPVTDPGPARGRSRLGR